MEGGRQDLDMPDLENLDDFDVPAAKPAHKVPGPSNDRERQAIDRAASFPSREAPDDDQLNIKGPKAVLDRFRALRKSERYKYADLLSMMMDAYDREKGQGGVT